MTARIIDTHVHIWDLQRAEYSWLAGDVSILGQTWSIDQLSPRISRAGVTEGILVQAANNAEDTALMLETAAATPWIKGVVGWLPLTNTAASEKALEETCLRNSYFKGCRHLIHNEADPKWLLQENVIKSLGLLAKHGLTYDIVGVNTAHLQTALKLAEKLPELKMTLDHLNQPPIRAGERFGLWGELMKEAAGHKNLYAKISGLGTTAGNGDQWSKADLKPYIMYALETFGTDRCFCGGDWPVALLAGPYEKAWLAYRQIFAEVLPEQEQEKLLYKNAAAFYGLPGENTP